MVDGEEAAVGVRGPPVLELLRPGRLGAVVRAARQEHLQPVGGGEGGEPLLVGLGTARHRRHRELLGAGLRTRGVGDLQADGGDLGHHVARCCSLRTRRASPLVQSRTGLVRC